MKSSKPSKSNEKMMEQGRIIAHAMNDLKVERKKNMIQAVAQREKMLEHAAEQALSGK